MNITLKQMLKLAGELKDTLGDDTPRERFRQTLKEEVHDIGQVRDYVTECLINKGDQYNRALQDLVNYTGEFLGFKVTFGRYHGVQGQIGFDGHWESPTGFHIVVEVKTTETYAINIATLLDYINRLVEEKRIPSPDKALGLYVIGRTDPTMQQLDDSIVAQNRTNELRVISVESLLSLAEMLGLYDMVHEDVVAILHPSGSRIDAVVDLMKRVTTRSDIGLTETGSEQPQQEDVQESKKVEWAKPAYWLTPVKSDEEETAEECITTLVGEERIYAFADKTPGRRHIKAGDWICFYATGKGVVAHAKVTSPPEREPNPKVRHAERYPWVFDLDSVDLLLGCPCSY